MLNDFSNESLKIMLMLIPVLLFSFAVHEFAHAYVAYKLGDISQKNKGRLTLDPFAHIDWMGFISLMLIGIGWGKPVEINTQNFKNPKKGLMLSALAGPIANLILSVIFTVILKVVFIILTAKLESSGGIDENSLFMQLFVPMIIQAINLNVFLAVFNLLPIPPFDGSKILAYFLPYKFRDVMFFLERYSFVIFLFLIVTNLHLIILRPAQNLIIGLLYKILFL